MSLEDIMLSEISQTLQKDKYCMIPLIWSIIEKEKKRIVIRAWGGEGIEGNKTIKIERQSGDTPTTWWDFNLSSYFLTGVNFKGSVPGPWGGWENLWICSLWLGVISLRCISFRGSKQNGVKRRKRRPSDTKDGSVFPSLSPCPTSSVSVRW